MSFERSRPNGAALKPLLIVKAGSTFAPIAARWGDFDDWVRHYTGLPAARCAVVSAYAGDPLPAATQVGAVVITGSHAMVTDEAPWSAALAAWLPRLMAAGVPLLGICYGHQLLARALGGRVDYHPRGQEVGSVGIALSPEGRRDELLGALPAAFTGHAAHAQSVLVPPPGAVVLAGNGFEPHHALRFGPRAWGVQFHPEFSGPVMRAYIEAMAGDLSAAGAAPARLRAAVVPTPAANRLLQRFAALSHP